MNSILIFRNYVKEYVGLFVRISSLLFIIFFALFKIITNNLLFAVFISVCTITLLLFATWHYYFSEQMKKIKIFGEVLDIEQYQARHSELFGQYMTLGGLNLSDLAFKYPIFLWADPTKTDEQIEKILIRVRETNQRVLIFEDGDSLYQKYSQENDILLNPFLENAYTWDIYEDYKANDGIMNYISEYSHLQCDEYLKAFKSCSFLHNSAEFLAALCFAPIDDIKPIMKEMKIDSSENTLVRKELSEVFSFLSFPTSGKNMSISNSNNIIWISCFQKSAMYKLSKFILETADKSSLKIVLQRNSHNIKTANTIVINPSLDEFYMRFDGTLFAIGSTNNNQTIASLFSQTTITNIMIGNTRYHNINRPAVSEKDLANSESFFKYYKSYDVLRI